MNIGGRSGGGGSKQWQTHAHTYTHTVSRDTQGGWSPAKESEAILPHIGLVLLLIKLMVYGHHKDAVGVGGAGNGKHIHTRIQTHSPSGYTGWMEHWTGSDTNLTHVGVAG